MSKHWHSRNHNEYWLRKYGMTYTEWLTQYRKRLFFDGHTGGFYHASKCARRKGRSGRSEYIHWMDRDEFSRSNRIDRHRTKQRLHSEY